MSAWVESQITTSTPVQQNRNHLCAQIKSTWPLGIFLTFFELYGISVFAPSQFFLAALAKWGQGVESVALVIHRGEASSLWRWCPTLRSPIWRWRSLIWRWRPSPWSKPSLLFSTAPIFIFFWPNAGMGSLVFKPHRLCFFINSLMWRHLFLHWTSTGSIKPFYTRHFANFIRITLEL